MSRDPFAFEKPARYGVMGHPVGHSLSPRIHAEFARVAGIAMTYEAIEVSPGGFQQAVSHFQALGGAGLNVTVPFKLEAAHLAHRLNPPAANARSVNVLMLGDEIVGDNTDGIGLLCDLRDNLELRLEGREALVLGAGGAARGILGPLSRAGLARLVLANRSRARARDLVHDLAGDLAIAVETVSFDALYGQHFDLVLNATSAGLSGLRPDVPGDVIGAGCIAYDLVYGPAANPFLVWASAQGARTFDGLGMLVEQAAESFRLWHGVRPKTREVLAQLRPQSA
ncbi:MAG: shikimate dehydrogenase [Acidiferrobacteraceae bacterium]